MSCGPDGVLREVLGLGWVVIKLRCESSFSLLIDAVRVFTRRVGVVDAARVLLQILVQEKEIVNAKSKEAF